MIPYRTAMGVIFYAVKFTVENLIIVAEFIKEMIDSCSKSKTRIHTHVNARSGKRCLRDSLTKRLSKKQTDFIVFRLGSCYYLVHTYDSIQLKCKGCMVLSR